MSTSRCRRLLFASAVLAWVVPCGLAWAGGPIDDIPSFDPGSVESHLGRVLVPRSPGGAPIIDLRNGSEPCRRDPNGGRATRCVTENGWIYERGGGAPELSLPSGVVYTFGREVRLGKNSYLYATRISDRRGNRIDIRYRQRPPLEAIATVTKTLAGDETNALPVDDAGVPVPASFRLIAADAEIAPHPAAAAPTLTLTPTSLTFAAVVGGSPPPSQTVRVESTGGTLSWTATASQNWLSASPANGTTPADITVAVHPRRLVAGTYDGTVTLSASGAAGSPQTLSVRLVVTSASSLVVSPTSLDFAIAEGGSANPASVDVLNSGGAVVGWTATALAPWLAVTPASGDTPGSFAVSVDGTGLQPGTYRSEITIDAPATAGSPQTVAVVLVVTKAAGADCEPGAYYCQRFDNLEDGRMAGQDGWGRVPDAGARVVADPRGAGKVLILATPPGKPIGDGLSFADQPIDGLEVAMQVMTTGVPRGARQVAKIEFFTMPGQAWGKSHAAFGALRFGESLALQYGQNINRVLVTPLEPGRWYDVRIVYKGSTIEAFVDGESRFTTANPLAPGLPMRGFGTTAWGFSGAGYLDLLEARPAP